LVLSSADLHISTGEKFIAPLLHKFDLGTVKH